MTLVTLTQTDVHPVNSQVIDPMYRITTKKIPPDTMANLHDCGAFVIYWQPTGVYEVWLTAIREWWFKEPPDAPIKGMYDEQHYRSGGVLFVYQRCRHTTLLFAVGRQQEHGYVKKRANQP